jgi:hypothetical protein
MERAPTPVPVRRKRKEKGVVLYCEGGEREGRKWEGRAKAGQERSVNAVCVRGESVFLR